MSSVLGSETAREGESAKPRREGGGYRGRAFNARFSPTVECTQAKRQELRYWGFANLVRKSHLAGYEGIRYPGSGAVSAALNRNSRLPLPLRDDDFGSRKAFLLALLCNAFRPKEHRANLVSSVDEVMFLKQLVWA